MIAALGEDEVREALDWSEAERPRLVGHIDGVLQEAEWTSSSDRGWVKERLAAAAEAGTEDLAPHVLLWHPRPDERGDQGLETASTGRGTLIGPCGLSERASRFGAGGGLLPIETERRLEVAWSLSTLAAGLTEMRGALTERSYKQHVAAPPEELHLWTVALWHAWNEMPPSGEDGGPSECVRLLVERAAHGRTLAPGEPILPSVVDVLTDGDWTLRTGVSARCPWRAGDLYQGVLLAERTLLEAALSLNEE